MAKRTIIVGAGYAGVEAALSLSKHDKKGELEIVLIDRNDYHTLLTELHEVAGNRISEDGVIIDLRRIFGNTRVKLVKDQITEFDFENKVLRSQGAEYAYDYLVMAMGSQPNFFGIEGMDKHAFTLWSYEDALKIRAHIRDCFVMASQTEDDSERARLLSFVVVGAGFTGAEMVGELVYYCRDLAAFYRVDKDLIKIRLVDALDKVLPVLGGNNSVKALNYMRDKLGIEVILGAGVKAIDEASVTVNDQKIETRTVIWAAGVRAEEDVEKMDIEKLRGRRLKVNEFGETQHKNVYAVGDLSGQANDKGEIYPAMVENAIQTAKGVAHNLLADLHGKKPRNVVVKMHGVMVCIGPFFAVSDLMGVKLPSWLSMLMKYVVNAHYLYTIIGFSGVFNYFVHECYEKRQRRFLLEAHWSQRMQAWYLVPLRIMLGITWLYEGIQKVREGWFLSPKLASFLGVATQAAADATTAATGEAGAAAAAFSTSYTELFRLNIGIIDFLVQRESKVLADATVVSSQNLIKLGLFHFGDFELMNWIVRHIVVATDGLAMFFQVLVVVLEMLVGLMLIGGAFSFLGAFISLCLMFMFFTTTGIYQSTWWMLIAGFAVMGGAGRAFGLDYYLHPYLNNFWDRLSKTKKLRFAFPGALKRWDDR